MDWNAIKRRRRVVTLFPNAQSLLQLVSALLMEISEGCDTGRVYIAKENGDSA